MVNWLALQTRTNTANLAVFGEAITLNGVPVQGDYCEPTDQVHMDGVSALANVPQVVVQSSDVPANPVGKTVVARARTFTVGDARPDGRGFTNLFLEVVL
jgi:hypothetical protein